MKNKLVAQWIQGIREIAENKACDHRVFDCFYESQLVSKMAIVDLIKNHEPNLVGSVHIIGGWYGVLGSLLLSEFPKIQTVYSWDVDPKCKVIGRYLEPSSKIRFITCDMKNIPSKEYFILPEFPRLIINTSTEHVTQDIFDKWISCVPDNIPVILQGNDYFECDEHVRCSNNLEQFKKQNPLNIILDESTFRSDNFNRFMTFGYK
jgi:hypothetical protein